MVDWWLLQMHLLVKLYQLLAIRHFLSSDSSIRDRFKHAINVADLLNATAYIFRFYEKK